MFLPFLTILVAFDGSTGGLALQYVGTLKGLSPYMLGLCGTIYFGASLLLSLTLVKLVYRIGYRIGFLSLCVFIVLSGFLLYSDSVLVQHTGG